MQSAIPAVIQQSDDIEATSAVRAAWALRTAAEYRSASLGSQMLHWAIQLGLSPLVIERLHSFVADELHHSELSREIHAAAGGTPEQVVVHRESLSFVPQPDVPLEQVALVAALEEFVLHESVALHAFRLILAQSPLTNFVRDRLSKIARDEARHCRTGALLLAELVQRTGQGIWLQSRVPPSMARLTQAYATSLRPSDAERAWGLLSDDGYTTAIASAARSTIRRALGRCHLSI